ncbi:nucleotidyl transferase AbiEii/AbiGii toxin family protein [Pseudomonas aeruginosa]|uniref:nucleotidyl transferase AbiEii/AbiGii toxin family protein n=1 Tax=Pseudomonas aeruginosa TaxID=287 RepID=UPI0031BA0742
MYVYQDPLLAWEFVKARELTEGRNTSLSKAYKVIDRFSEDIDLKYDIRELNPELTDESDLPSARSEARRWTERVRERLPGWIQQAIDPGSTQFRP